MKYEPEVGLGCSGSVQLVWFLAGEQQGHLQNYKADQSTFSTKEGQGMGGSREERLQASLCYWGSSFSERGRL